MNQNRASRNGTGPILVPGPFCEAATPCRNIALPYSALFLSPDSKHHPAKRQSAGPPLRKPLSSIAENRCNPCVPMIGHIQASFSSPCANHTGCAHLPDRNSPSGNSVQKSPRHVCGRGFRVDLAIPRFSERTGMQSGLRLLLRLRFTSARRWTAPCSAQAMCWSGCRCSSRAMC